METYDIQIELKVLAEDEQEAELVVSNFIDKELTKAALNRQILSWDFFNFGTESVKII